jgi:hypothetical protein
MTQIDGKFLFQNIGEKLDIMKRLKEQKSIKNFCVEQQITPDIRKWVMLSLELINYLDEACILIGITDITISYHRPAVKSRMIFAEAPAAMEARAKGEATLDNQNERKPGEPIVPYNHVWRAGANEATVFQATDDVLINGQPLKAGSYSLAAIPGKDEWTIIFNNDPGQWGILVRRERRCASKPNRRRSATRNCSSTRSTR